MNGAYAWRAGRVFRDGDAPGAGHGRYDLVALAGSAGGIEALYRILAALPRDFPVPIAVVQHGSVRDPNILARLLSRHTRLTVKTAEEGERLKPGTVYLAPGQLHATVDAEHRVHLKNGHRIRHVLSSANPLFESAAKALRGRLIAVVLTGYDSDGTDGVQAVKAAGGTVLAQDEASSRAFAMPRSAIATGAVEAVLPLDQIAPELLRRVGASA